MEQIRSKFAKLLRNKEFVYDKLGGTTIEIINATFEATDETLFGVPNLAYIEKELEWYKSQSLYVYDLKDTPTIWKNIASKDGQINSNYGWCIFHKDNYDQYYNVLEELSKNPDSRRGLMIYTRPSMWYDYNKDGMSDFMCTSSVQYLIRNNKLISIVTMRSNDAVFGYRNDKSWQDFVHKKLATDLEVELGSMYWNAGSLHVYDRHYHLVEEYDTEKTKTT